MEVEPDAWIHRLADLSDGEVERLGGGMEGTVYRLRPGTVAKVWHSKPVAELEAMRRAYDDVSSVGPPIRTPLLHDVLLVDGVAVTIERELPGTALQGRLDFSAPELSADTVDAVVRCLLALRTVPATDALLALPVLGEAAPFRVDGFVASLIALLDRRFELSGPALGTALPNAAPRHDALRARLAELDPPAESVIHGDLFGANIHVDATGEPVALLDFGFMTTAGDPRFDAAVTAGIMNMYGPHAARITRQMTAELARQLAYDPDVLVLYRAAYAVATCTLFGDDLSDGHFRWCVAQLSDRSMLEVLGV